jgi:hypothetical protein
MKRFIIALTLLFILTSAKAQTQVYELRTYTLEFFRPADLLHDYFKSSLIPALNRQGVEHVGVFEEMGEALPKKLYLLVAYNDIQAFQNSAELLNKDEAYQKKAEAYLKADTQKVPYLGYSTDLILSTSGFPELVKPADGASYFELRIYTSYNEDALRRKVKMFNDSEFSIFKEVGLPTVFFGSNIAGNHMPCLTYLLGFKDKAAHDAAWDKFGPNPEWQRISNAKEYENAMNNIIRVFLKPLDYSQL